MKRVLIALHSTIPHYRIPFYNTLERLRPDSWRFETVFDPSEVTAKRFFKEPLDTTAFRFPILPAHTLSVKLGAKRLTYQTFWRRAGGYDLIIVGLAFRNLTYPLCQLHQRRASKFMYWGHGKDRDVEKPSFPRVLAEKVRVLLARRADGFMAYTPGVKQYLTERGVPSEKIFALNNTIDITHQRATFERLAPQREEIRSELGLHGKKVLLYVGRFTENKRVGFLLESFSLLRKADPQAHLVMVGGGGEAYLNSQRSDITYLGPIVDLEKLGRVYVASDFFAFPGSVGLGPLQALCYDLPVVTVDSPTHMPEFEYLSPRNSLVLEASTTPEDYARTMGDLLAADGARLRELRASTWPSIEHLTIEAMAQAFIRGVNTTLGL